MKARRVGLFGGTFDPPHFGHVAALCAAVATGRFDVIEVTVAGEPYFKGGSESVRPAPVRLAMATAAFADMEFVHVSDREIRRQGPSYSIDTVRELLDEAEQVDLLVGADLVEQLDGWFESSVLRTLVRVGVVPRPGAAPLVPEGWDRYEIAMEGVDLSSTYIRNLSLPSVDLRDFIPELVIPIYEGAQR